MWLFFCSQFIRFYFFVEIFGLKTKGVRVVNLMTEHSSMLRLINNDWWITAYKNDIKIQNSTNFKTPMDESVEKFLLTTHASQKSSLRTSWTILHGTFIFFIPLESLVLVTSHPFIYQSRDHEHLCKRNELLIYNLFNI